MSQPREPRRDLIRDGYAFQEPSVQLGVLADPEPVVEVPIRIPVSMFNRHGLVAGATGTGKTKTLQVMAEALSSAGVPVFAADIKGDLSGLAMPGTASEKLQTRADQQGQPWQPTAYPCEFFALGGEGIGVPLRASVSSFGPILLSKVLDLNQTQESTLGLVFYYADKAGLPLLDLADLTELLKFLTTSDEGKAELKQIGGVSSATVGVILRNLVTLAEQGGDRFFGEPEFDSAELMRTTPDGRGIVSLLELPDLASRPALFSTFLMWLLADLFETLPEVGDLEQPKLVFFFDEAHLLFKDASKAFLEAITQTVRLIRSKGVGVFFVTQTPKDVPGDVLAQLGSRVQHQLRAHTPNDAKALKATVSTYPLSDYDLSELLQSLGTGEAIVTVMNPKGAPTPVAWTRIWAPQASMDPAPAEDLRAGAARSILMGRYGVEVDRESAREMLAARLEAGARKAEAEQAPPDPSPTSPTTSTRRRSSRDKGLVEQVTDSTAFKQFVRTAAREIVRGIFGTSRRG
ncbi:MAG: helicase HerA-like domain-containing protein [Arachnia sp.]